LLLKYRVLGSPLDPVEFAAEFAGFILAPNCAI
jgi:hypothetical protein